MQMQIEIPAYETVSAIYSDSKKRQNLIKSWLSVLLSLMCSFSLASILALLLFPIEKIYGDNLSPELDNDDIVLLAKLPEYQRGDLVCLNLGDFCLVKRIVGIPGDYIDFNKDNHLLVNNVSQKEDYLIDNDNSDFENIYPYQVPDGCYFVLSDKRSIVTDSRLSEIGAVKQESLVGKVFLRI